ncbi:biotin-dependent carboxyltransferase family protein [uncultured Eubacterium sp.]|uniref:5-oxoprolinase subunit C family protein n=1 Tax=uncultured Eubacterium sp. TaxID=165185 RepID=UPI000E842B10|nr:biotin-dependent carboxyltransferase family protein [uncultured Eubacterium sp.]HAT83005.1 KipI antagonist [Eubacterium sp.]
MSIFIENPGMQTSVQDLGRIGYQRVGIPPGGPMDTRSFRLANIIAGNDQNEAELEVTFTGPTILFEQDNVIAITGGDLGPQLNNCALPMYQAVSVHAGDRLHFRGMTGKGCRSYIAFAGGLDIPLIMESRSTILKYGVGGYKGRKLERGDRISFRKPVSAYPDMEKRSLWPEKFGSKAITLRVLLGPQDDMFTKDDLLQFFWFDSTVTAEYDRMGCRLKISEPLHPSNLGNIISDGIAFGAIQVPTNGQPIIMMADRQTIGGYTKIGTVISADLPLLAQAMPGDHIHFVKMDIRTAQTVYRREMTIIQEYDRELNGTL